MKGCDQQNTSPQNAIENWTLQQCQDYLTKYPNGLKVDMVKKQLDKLTDAITDVITSVPQKTRKTSPNKGVVVPPVCEQTKKSNSYTEKVIYVLKVIVTIILIAIGIGVVIAAFSAHGKKGWISAFWFAIMAPALKVMWDYK